MKKQIVILGILLLYFTSCESFLAEEPESFLTPGQFYATPEQIQVAVDGAYYGKGEFGGDPTDSGLAWPYLSTFLGLPISEFLAFESMTGLSMNVFGSGEGEQVYQRLDGAGIPNTNPYLSTAFNGIYVPLENVNSVIANIAETEVIDEATRDRYLGEMYFLRAYLYFRGVRLFGEIPLKTTPTVDLTEIEIPKATINAIYDQIVTDLTAAEEMGLEWVDPSGHADLGAVKALLAEVYLTMAGYPSQRGAEYYDMAYEKSREIIDSGEYELFDEYADLRNPSTFNEGEHVFMLQRKANVANNPLHYDMSPGPEDPEITVNQNFEPALLPTMDFYNSYDAGDRRTEDEAYFYEYTPGEVMNYKYWDEAAAEASPSGANIPQIRYADVLLTNAEAKANADGGTTSDPVAVKAYFDVRNRAFPAEVQPASITVDDVLKERFWEQSFEYKIWFTQIRTRRTLDTGTSEIVDLIGYTPTNHVSRGPFIESNLLLPLPNDQILLNPMLEEPAQ